MDDMSLLEKFSVIVRNKHVNQVDGDKSLIDHFNNNLGETSNEKQLKCLLYQEDSDCNTYQHVNFIHHRANNKYQGKLNRSLSCSSFADLSTKCRISVCGKKILRPLSCDAARYIASSHIEHDNSENNVSKNIKSGDLSITNNESIESNASLVINSDYKKYDFLCNIFLTQIKNNSDEFEILHLNKLKDMQIKYQIMHKDISMYADIYKQIDYSVKCMQDTTDTHNRNNKILMSKINHCKSNNTLLEKSIEVLKHQKQLDKKSNKNESLSQYKSFVINSDFVNQKDNKYQFKSYYCQENIVKLVKKQEKFSCMLQKGKICQGAVQLLDDIKAINATLEQHLNYLMSILT